MAVNLSPYGGVGAQFLDNAGNVLTGGKIETYAAGTTTPQAVYTDATGVTFHPNPIILDASGRVPSGGEIWLTDGLLYKFVLRDSANVLIATYDNIAGINSNFVNFTNQQEIQTATAGQTVFTLTTTNYSPGTNSLSVFVDGVNQYGPGAQYAYLETNSTTVTFVNGLHVGALVKFTTSQSNSSGGTNASVVVYDPAGAGAVSTTVQTKLRETVSVQDFGVIGDGVADDTIPLQVAIANGGVLLANGLTIRTTSPITATITSDITFDFQQTKIVYDGAAAAAYVLQLNLQGCTLSGQIEIDCVLKSHKGLYVTNTSNNASNLDLTPIVRNCYKTITTISGDGLWLDGLFDTVRLQNPVFENMVMASGAGVIGVSGIRGATIKALSGTQYPKMVEIINPRVVDVYSEDTSYIADQDGIAVFSPEDTSAAPDYDPFEQKAFISGGLMKNCMGRAFKFQNQYAEVIGTHFERTTPLAVAPWGVEVDFQTGGGEVSNVTARYTNGSTPLRFCLLNTPQTAAFVVPYGTARGIKIFTDANSSACMQAVVHLAQRTITGSNRIYIADVSVVGNIQGVVGINPINSGDPFFISCSGLRAAPTLGLVYAYGSSASGGTVCVSDCIYTGSGSVPAFFRTSTTSQYTVSANNVWGFDDYKTVTANNQGVTLRPHSIAATNQITSGMLRPVAFTIADGASFALPPTALNGQTNMLLVTVGAGRNAQAIFSSDSSQVIALAAGSDWVVGTTTEPVTGTYRIWSGTSGQTISNRSGITRTFTVLMFG